jgi:hypothetical protein
MYKQKYQKGFFGMISVLSGTRSSKVQRRQEAGTASQGGTTGNGNFFHLVPPAPAGGTWTLTPLHQFAGGNAGSQGSTSGQSTVYKIIP